MSYTKEEIKEGLEILEKIRNAIEELDAQISEFDGVYAKHESEECPKEWIELIEDSHGLFEETIRITDIFEDIQGK